MVDEYDRNDWKRILDRWEEVDDSHPYNAQLYGDEKFDGPVKKRKCTDIAFLIVFVLMNLGLCYVFYLVVTQGDPARLSHGYDFRAEICGHDDLEDRPFMYFPDPYLLEFPLCLEECPEFFLTDYVCIYDVDHVTLHLDRDCWDTWESTSYGFYCLPVFEDERKIVLDWLYEPLAFIRRSTGDLTLAWDAPLFGAGISFLVGFAYLTFYKFPSNFYVDFMHGLIVLSIISTECLLSFFIYLFLVGYWRSYEELCEGTIIEPEYCNTDYFIHYFYFIGFTSVFIIIYTIVIIFQRKKIKLGIMTIQLCCKPINTLKQLYLYPIFQFFVGAIFLSVSGLILLYSLSSGVIEVVEDEDIPDGKAKTIVFSVLNQSTIGYSFLMSIWWIAFLSALGEYILSAAISIWYFQRERSFLFSPLLNGFKSIMRYHIGSVVRGALFNTIFKFPRFITDLYRRCLMNMKKKHGTCANFFARSCCCLACHQKWLRFFTKYSYIFLALFGETYFIAAQKSYFLLKRQKNRILSPAKAGEFDMTLIKITITLSGASVAFAIVLLPEKTFTGQETDRLVAELFIAFFTMILCAYIAEIIAGTMQTTMNTVLMCGVCDEEMFTREQRYIDQDLQNFLDNVYEEQTEQHRDHKRKVKITKAQNAYIRDDIDPLESTDRNDVQPLFGEEKVLRQKIGEISPSPVLSATPIDLSKAHELPSFNSKRSVFIPSSREEELPPPTEESIFRDQASRDSNFLDSEFPVFARKKANKPEEDSADGTRPLFSR